ncbi:energy-coupling factor ABC transporter permease [Pediococcus claussenii]|uniref:energy-coupling factor ABC transporter permease n=1 Tax=Pediococcus claussenii TaxID=187452 RepID=UPI00068352CF|nr:energy-coupling factor ABC transporter permease [Pediococcus claussenii]ANZ70500.1 cobalamin biosynthesis protein CbiM [Pediococcus claussenii]ANZ72315.1 cobalamin biosynthesis protein CbiM [Pediococcus claussenii]
MLLALGFTFVPTVVHAMHIMEGMLPPLWCVFWYAVSLPFFMYGLYRLKKISENSNSKNTKLMFALCGAFVFVLSSLKLPSVTGSSSHPTGVGLGTVMFGPGVLVIMGVIVLLFQALLLAHGGLTTLGANAFSMTIVGPIIGFLVLILCKKMNVNKKVAIFLCAFFADLSTYVTTAFQLAVVFPDPNKGILGAAVKFMGIYAVTQVPLALAEGFLTVIVYNLIVSNGLWKEGSTILNEEY